MAISNPAGVLRSGAVPLLGSSDDYDDLLDRVGDTPLVLLGEASHGTDEFYRMRAEITKRLIVERGFTAVAVEADWPDAHRVHRYVIGGNDDDGAEHALRSFKRFPRWMWRNRHVLDFVEWLRHYNDRMATRGERVGFYGLDLYSLHASRDAVLTYLTKADPAMAIRASERYSCFENVGGDLHEYGARAALGEIGSCEEDAIAQLEEIRELDVKNAIAEDHDDELFFAEQNARLIVNADAYYRSVFKGRGAGWNIRDTHMADTLDVLIAYLVKHHQRRKVVVWEHNSHIGDARATSMGVHECTVGQLVRERYGAENAVLVGFTTFDGAVTAANDWDRPAEKKRIVPAIEGSWESLFHRVGLDAFMLSVNDPMVEHVLRASRLERAIGVVYRPMTERISHYFDAWIGKQFDVVIHVDRTSALEPLDSISGWKSSDAPDTYPYTV